VNLGGLAIVTCTMDRRGAGDGRPSAPGPLALTPTTLALVWAGGTVGTAARYLTARAVPHLLGVPVATLAVNLLGAFALGLLLHGLGTRRARLRLLLGTGFLGGFTTYSALAFDTVLLARRGLPGHAIGYAAATLLLGVAASVVGVLVAGRWTGRHRSGGGGRPG